MFTVERFVAVLGLMFITLILMSFTSIKAKENNIQAIIFDLGGVVVEADPYEAIRFIKFTFDLNENEAKEALMEFKSFWIDGGSEKEFWEAYALERERALSENWLQQWHEVLLNSIKEIPGTVEIIQQLKKEGFTVALLSNARKDQAEHIQKLGYYDLFKPALISCEIGYEKPDPQAFQVLLKELELSPNLCLFIDDKRENVEAAKKLGIDSIQFVNPQQLIEELAKRNIFILLERNLQAAGAKTKS